MTPDQWIAFGTLVVAVVTLAVGGVVSMVKVSFKLGSHAERMSKLESIVKETREDRLSAQEHVTQLAVMTQMMGGMKGDLEAFMAETRRWKDRVDGDIRSILVSKSAANRSGQ